MNNIYKRSFFIGAIAYALLLVLSIMFYKERNIFTDMAFYLFDMVSHGTFTIQHFRFSGVITQFIPYLAIKSGASLSSIMLLYSMAFILYSFLCFWLCGYVFKNYTLSFVLLFFNLLLVSDSFYSPVSELPQGVAFMLLFIAIFSRYFTKANALHFIIAFVFLFITVFFHPLISICFFFTIAFFLLRDELVLPKKNLIIYSVLFIAAFLIKKHFFRTEYDANSLNRKNFVSFFPNYFNLYSNKRFLLLCVTKYLWLPVSLIAICVVYIRQKAWLKMLFIIVAVLGYALVVDISFPGAETRMFYVDNFYAVIGLFLALPLAYDVIPFLKKQNIQLGFIVLVVITGCARIYQTHDVYTTRLNWERNFLKEHADKKLVMGEQDMPMDTLIISWSTPYEFWLLSTTETGKTASLMITKTPGDFTQATSGKKNFQTPWATLSYSSLPQQYFIFTDTTTTYTIVK